MKIFQYPLILIAVASISACSSSPSEGDIEEALTLGLLKNCPSLAISNASKVNGTPDENSDKIYGIETEFTIELKPIKENKKIASDIPGHIKEIQKMQSQHDLLNQRWYEIMQKTRTENSDLNDGQIMKIIASDPEIQKLQAEDEAFEKIYSRFFNYKGSEEQILMDAMTKRIREECVPLGVNPVLLSKVLPKEVADFKDSFYTNFKGIYTLRKTDNGWRIAN